MRWPLRLQFPDDEVSSVAASIVARAKHGSLLTRPLSVAAGFVLVGDPGGTCATNQDADIRDRNALLIDKNQICRSQIQRLENDGAIVLGADINDIGIADQHGLERPLKRRTDWVPSLSAIDRSTAHVLETVNNRSATPKRQARKNWVQSVKIRPAQQ